MHKYIQYICAENYWPYWLDVSYYKKSFAVYLFSSRTCENCSPASGCHVKWVKCV